MRGKRAKQYRKLMHQYALTFGFREPYQVLVDADIVNDATRMKIDLASYLERTLQGKVKPMITQCSMRHLYATKDQEAIGKAQAFERRRCGHHTLEEPLSTLECIRSVLDPKDSKTNKHRYVVASQEQKVRAYLRQIPGVPLIYINRSVMIMEPMAGATEDVRDQTEKEKFRAGLKTRPAAAGAVKRKRNDDDGSSDEEGQEGGAETAVVPPEPTKKKTKKPKGPNPLSAKKPKKRPNQEIQQKPKREAEKPVTEEESHKRKRKRKNKSNTDGTATEQVSHEA